MLQSHIVLIYHEVYLHLYYPCIVFNLSRLTINTRCLFSDHRIPFQRYNVAYSAPSLNLSQVTMLPSVTWHTAVETREDDTLPWMGAAQAHYFTDYYLVSHSHSKIQV